MMNSNLTAVLEKRDKTHGSFEDNARVSQSLKGLMNHELGLRSRRGQPPLNARQLEALDMIFLKIGRILTGDATHEDHWTDIAGYSQIAKTPLDKALAKAVEDSFEDKPKGYVLKNEG